MTADEFLNLKQDDTVYTCIFNNNCLFNTSHPFIIECTITFKNGKLMVNNTAINDIRKFAYNHFLRKEEAVAFNMKNELRRIADEISKIENDLVVSRKKYSECINSPSYVEMKAKHPELFL